MSENIFIGAYWGARKESKQKCAERLFIFLESINHNPLTSHWFLQARSRKQANKPLELSVETIENILKPIGEEVDDSPFSEAGFSFGAWNGRENAPISFLVSCGSFSPYVKNAAVLDLPPYFSIGTDNVQVEIKEFFEKIINAWDPENAVAARHELISRKSGVRPWERDIFLFNYRKK